MSAFNEQFFLWINSLAGGNSLLDGLVKLLATDYFVPTSLSLIMVGMWFAGRDPAQRHRFQRGVLAAPLAIIIVNVAVNISNSSGVTGTRPFEDYPQAMATARSLFYAPPDPSFPSNSAAVAFALAGLLALVDRRVGVVAIGLSTGLGFARVYAGVHYPFDILAGAALGLLGATLAWKVLGLLEPIPSLVLRLGRRLFLA